MQRLRPLPKPAESESALNQIPRGLGYTLLIQYCLVFEEEGASLVRYPNSSGYVFVWGKGESEENDTGTELV